MAYTAYNAANPTVSQTRQAGVGAIRTNLVALRDIIAGAGMAQGFDYQPSGGTASQPANLWFKRGTEVVKEEGRRRSRGALSLPDGRSS